MWYYFYQNNSGGFYKPPAMYIFVEAETSEQANEVASSIEGVYFRGVSSGADCSCCGDRWSPAYSDDSGYDTLEECISSNYFCSSFTVERAEEEGTNPLKIVFKQEEEA